MLEKVMGIAEEHKDIYLVCLVLGKKAAAQAEMGDVDAALLSLETARKMAVSHELVWMLGFVYCSYTDLLLEHGEDDKAMTYAHETMRLAKDEGDVQLIMKAAALLVRLYTSKGQELEAHEARGTEVCPHISLSPYLSVYPRVYPRVCTVLNYMHILDVPRSQKGHHT